MLIVVHAVIEFQCGLGLEMFSSGPSESPVAVVI